LDSLRFRHSNVERLIRRAFADALNRLPGVLYRLLTDVLKRWRATYRLNRTVSFAPGPYMQLAGLPKGTQTRRQQRTVRACLTHDVDTADCAAFWPDLVRIEERFGIASTYNILTAGPYRLDTGWLDDLEARGFEVGLHGDFHDTAFGFRKPQLISDRLQRCLDVLGRPVIGYRAPALAISDTLLALLNGLGFRYDSSISANIYYARGVDVCIPYVYPGTGLWEFPLVLQDDGLFRDRRLNDEDALTVVLEVLEAIKPFGGLFVFNSHPSHLQRHPSFYDNLLACLAEQQFEVLLARNLAEHLDAAFPVYDEDPTTEMAGNQMNLSLPDGQGKWPS